MPPSPSGRPVTTAQYSLRAWPAAKAAWAGVEGGAAEGDHEAAGRVGVETVGEPGAGFAAGQEGKQVLDARAAAGAGVDGEAGRLVEDDEAVVGEQDGEIGAEHSGVEVDRAGGGLEGVGPCLMTGFAGPMRWLRCLRGGRMM